MVVSDVRFAAQIVAPLEEPKFFDDLGCLRDWAGGGGVWPEGAVAYVADHRTKTWIVASEAIYSRVPGLATPMASGLVAHADGASRDADGEARGGVAVEAAEVIPEALAQGGTP